MKKKLKILTLKLIIKTLMENIYFQITQFFFLIFLKQKKIKKTQSTMMKIIFYLKKTLVKQNLITLKFY